MKVGEAYKQLSATGDKVPASSDWLPDISFDWLPDNPIDWISKSTAIKAGAALSMINMGRAHKRQAQMLDPNWRSWDNFAGGAIKSGMQTGGAIYLGAIANAGAWPVLSALDGGATTLPAMYLLHNRSMRKRVRNMESSSLTRSELDDRFGAASLNPNKDLNRAKLDHLMKLYTTAIDGSNDEATRKAAKHELYSIPGWGDGTGEFNKREPIDVQRDTRTQVGKVLRFLFPKMPKVPKGIAGSAPIDLQKEAIFNAFIRRIAATNPPTQNNYGVPFWQKGRENGYYDANDAADVILDNIQLPSFTSLSQAYVSASPHYWKKNRRVRREVIENVDAQDFMLDAFVAQFPLTGANQAEIDERARVMYGRKVKARRSNPPVVVPYEFDDVDDTQFKDHLRDKNKFIQAFQRTSQVEQDAILQAVETEPSGDGKKVIEDLIRKHQPKSTVTRSDEAGRINKRILNKYGDRTVIPPELAAIADVSLQFMPSWLIGEQTKNAINAILAAIQYGSVTNVFRELKDLRKKSTP